MFNIKSEFKVLLNKSSELITAVDFITKIPFIEIIKAYNLIDFSTPTPIQHYQIYSNEKCRASVVFNEQLDCYDLRIFCDNSILYIHNNIFDISPAHDFYYLTTDDLIKLYNLNQTGLLNFI